MADPGQRHTGRSTRTTVVVLVLLAGLVAAGGVGASMLFEEIPASESAPETVTCWDGEQRTDPSACGRPTGLKGLRWVFPALRPDDESCRDVLAESPSLPARTVWTCEFEVSGAPVQITYIELNDTRESLAYLLESYDDTQRSTVEVGGRPVRFEGRRPYEDGFAVVSIYAKHPFAVEVRAEDRDLREQALATVSFRPPSAIRFQR